MRADKELKTGSLEQPFKRTPRTVGSTKKWRTSSSPFWDFDPGGGWATRTTKPKASKRRFEKLIEESPNRSQALIEGAAPLTCESCWISDQECAGLSVAQQVDRFLARNRRLIPEPGRIPCKPYQNKLSANCAINFLPSFNLLDMMRSDFERLAVGIRRGRVGRVPTRCVSWNSFIDVRHFMNSIRQVPSVDELTKDL